MVKVRRGEKMDVPDIFPWFGPGCVYEQPVKKV
jgi:hypothetical protein